MLGPPNMARLHDGSALYYKKQVPRVVWDPFEPNPDAISTIVSPLAGMV